MNWRRSRRDRKTVLAEARENFWAFCHWVHREKSASQRDAPLETRNQMRSFLSRRRLLVTAAAGLSVAATPVRAQSLAAREKFSASAPVSIEVDARPVP